MPVQVYCWTLCSVHQQQKHQTVTELNAIVSIMTNEKTDINRLVDHLFRHESGRLIAVLTRVLGSFNLELAEDVVQDALAEAITHWTYKGIPDNPEGWIFSVAKNIALNILKREKYKHQYLQEAVSLLQTEQVRNQSLEHLFTEQEIRDGQLRMIFTCCHPSVSVDSQIALTLKSLCGFSISEIAKAFLSSDETINKRLVRARRMIRENRITFEVPAGKELEARLEAVLKTIYLLFNEGYSASEGDRIIRYDLCAEAIRLAEIIVSHPAIQRKTNVFALLALMLLNASRFEARQNSEGELTELAKQNRVLWSQEMINKGIEYLNKATGYGTVSQYHILAAISAHHCTASSDESTDWKSILALYDNLLQINDSVIVILNRAVAVSKVFGTEQAIKELKKLEDNRLLKNYSYYYFTLGEFFFMKKDPSNAISHFEKALSLTENQPEINLLHKKINLCRSRT